MHNDYEHALASWRERREAGLRADFSWLSLAGLFWLRHGIQTLGAGPSNDIDLGETSLREARLGSLELDGPTLNFLPATGISVVRRAASHPHEETALSGDRVTLKFDVDDDAFSLRIGDVLLTALRREERQKGTRYALRVHDRARPSRTTFAGCTWYPAATHLRFDATFERYERVLELPIKNVFGNDIVLSAIGKVRFSHEGQSWALEASEDDGKLFLNFRDTTNGRGSYNAGRFLFVDMPTGPNFVLDFNRAINPPCVFTPWATCPRPHESNSLPFAVEAGEKFTDSSH